MTRTALGVLVLAAGLGALACDGREVAIFDVPSRVGTSGSSGAAGLGGAAGGGAGGTDVVAGAGTGGSAAGLGGGGGLGSDGGSAGLASAGMAGAGGSAPASCGSDVDCSPGWVCDKRGCEATQGLCVPRPPICSADPTPVCGCDGITYWNDCLRLQTHAQLAGPDPCVATACTCEVGADCKVPYASCSHLVGPGEMCGHGMGACWMLPPQCVPNADNKMWRECKPPDAGPPGPCVDTCKAIESEHSYAQLHRGDTCN